MCSIGILTLNFVWTAKKSTKTDGCHQYKKTPDYKKIINFKNKNYIVLCTTFSMLSMSFDF